MQKRSIFSLAAGLSLCFVFLLNTGCGSSSKSTDDETHTLNGNSYVTVSNTSLVLTDTSLSGDGSVVFESPLPTIESKRSFTLGFTLENGGSLTLHSNASNRLQNGISIVISRTGTTLSVALKKGEDLKDISSSFTGVNASGSLSIVCDVHNDEVPAHILIWTGSDFTEEAAVFNSEEEGLEAPGNGAGSYWGLALSKATVSTATVSTAKFSEE